MANPYYARQVYESSSIDNCHERQGYDYEYVQQEGLDHERQGYDQREGLDHDQSIGCPLHWRQWCTLLGRVSLQVQACNPRHSPFFIAGDSGWSRSRSGGALLSNGLKVEGVGCVSGGSDSSGGGGLNVNGGSIDS